MTRNEVTGNPKDRKEITEGTTQGKHSPSHLPDCSLLRGQAKKPPMDKPLEPWGPQIPEVSSWGPIPQLLTQPLPELPVSHHQTPSLTQPLPDPIAHPQHAKPLTHGPPTKEVDLKVVVKDDNCVLLPKVVHGGLVGEESALRAGPPLQEHDQLCGRVGSALQDACPCPPLSSHRLWECRLRPTSIFIYSSHVCKLFQITATLSNGSWVVTNGRSRAL